MKKKPIDKEEIFNLSNKSYSNFCIRCGKERIEKKSWKEKVINFMGSTVITHIDTVCPDPACQKIVETELQFQKDKKDKVKQDKELRKTALKKGIPQKNLDE